MRKQDSIETMIKKLYGLPPFDDSYNVCKGDGYYQQSIINKFGEKLFREVREKLSVHK